jgi:tetratricopeptide (TPR) repeat protein
MTRHRHAVTSLAFSLLVLAHCVCASAATLSPAEADSLLRRAERALEEDEIELAERLYREADTAVDDGRVEYGYALVALARDDHDSAIDHARAAIKRDRRNSDFHLALAYGYGLKAAQGGMQALFYAGKYKGACEKAVEYDPENVDAHFAVLQYYLMAPGFAGGGGEKAEETIRTIESLDTFYGHLARAFQAWVADDVEAAEREYVTAAHVDTASVDGWGALGMFYMEQEQYGKAIPVGERILRLEPDNLDAVYALAKAHLLEGDDLDAAAAGFSHYIEQGGARRGATEAEARWRLGMVHSAAGRLEEARAEWLRSLELDPEFERARALLDSLDAHHPELR